MQELAWIAETLRVWMEGGSWADIKATDGFQHLIILLAALIPSTIIAMGIGLTDWRETPLAQWLGFNPRDPDADWAERARDLDKDGTADF
jgi:hypothetical protein